MTLIQTLRLVDAILLLLAAFFLLAVFVRDHAHDGLFVRIPLMALTFALFVIGIDHLGGEGSLMRHVFYWRLLEDGAVCLIAGGVFIRGYSWSFFHRDHRSYHPHARRW